MKYQKKCICIQNQLKTKKKSHLKAKENLLEFEVSADQLMEPLEDNG